MKTKKLHLSLIAFATFNMQLLTHKADAQGSFATAVSYSVGTNPQSVAGSDFNGDGKADLAVANYGSSNVSILLGDGIGGFGAPTNFAVGVDPFSVTIADFDGDGHSDLATSSMASNSISVLLGNGAGNFGAFTNFVVGNSTISITSADFNADGNVDLAASSISNANVSVLLGDGTGNFGASSSFSGGDPVSVISADFNGDGKADLATANQALNNVSIRIGDGLGSFGAATNFVVGSSPSSIFSADFNGDGKADLTTGNQGSNKVSVLLGDGLGSFATATNFSVGSNPYSVTSGDFNMDGNADLVVTNLTSSNVSVLIGNGTGGFGTATNFAVGGNPKSVISNDFNGDGKADLAVANFNSDDVSVLLNNFLPAAAPLCLVTVDSTLTHNVLVWEKTNLDMTAIDSFVVYREITTGNYQRIGSVFKNSLSTFDDLASNPATTGYRYKLVRKSPQGVASQFSDYHNTIYLTNTGANFSWTPYQIENNTTPVASYNVYRDDNSTGDFQTIGNTTGNQFGYTDVNFASFPNAQYYVEAVMAAGVCSPSRSSFTTSRSNVKHFGISGVQQLNTNASIKIYPNPANNTLNIIGITDKTTLRLYNIIGKLVMEKEIENNSSINTSQYAEGIYTLLSESKTGCSFNKVVISH